MADTYRTVGRPAAAEIRVKGSRFLAEALPVEDAAAAEAEIERIRRREHGATHHCTAYRVGADGAVFRYNDGGEPAGTAGAPILRQIDARRLTNALVVVTRYFGGTKLGTGGLLRAYGEAAARALEAAPVEEHVIRLPVRVRFAYDDTSPALHVLSRFDADVRQARYAQETELLLGVRRSEVDAFVRAFTDALGGRGRVERLPGEEAVGS